MTNIKVLNVTNTINGELLTYEENGLIKETTLPFNIGERYIHCYGKENNVFLFGIGLNKEELFIDEEECGNLELKDYQEILKDYGAKIYNHTFEYHDGFKKEVQDSYFEDINNAIRCTEYLNSI